MALENMYARVRGRIQGNGSQRDNIFIFKGDREEGKWTAECMKERQRWVDGWWARVAPGM